MNQRKDNYRAALARDRSDPPPPTRKVTTLSSRYVRITIEIDPDVQRGVERWVTPPVALLTSSGAAARRVLTAIAAKPPSSGSRT